MGFFLAQKERTAEIATIILSNEMRCNVDDDNNDDIYRLNAAIDGDEIRFDNIFHAFGFN